VDDTRLPAAPANGYHAARIALAEGPVRGALCIVPANEIAALGLPADRFDSIGFTGLDNHPGVAGVDIAELRRMVGPHTERLGA
jgi:hypothetical protein